VSGSAPNGEQSHTSLTQAKARATNFRYPVFLDLSGKRCLVAGEGYEIAAKVGALEEAGAQTIYVSPRAEPSIAQLSREGRIEWRQREFIASDLEGCFLAISSLEDNAAVFQLAEERNILCNAVDDPANCRFSFGSVHRQGELAIAISTNGWAPALAVRLREKLAREVGPEYGLLVDILKGARPAIREGIGDFEKRREAWYRIVDSQALALLREGRNADAEELVDKIVRDAMAR
jgi:precorrin-2 dehydrogenase / sirohydrochlorin ferrochelatase